MYFLQEKESLITELRKELRLSNEEHRELLGRVNADDVIRRIRSDRLQTCPLTEKRDIYSVFCFNNISLNAFYIWPLESGDRQVQHNLVCPVRVKLFMIQYQVQLFLHLARSRKAPSQLCLNPLAGHLHRFHRWLLHPINHLHPQQKRVLLQEQRGRNKNL